MSDFSVMRNAERYIDETAGNGIVRADMPQAGEIWRDSRGYDKLILKNNRSYCTVALLKDPASLINMPQLIHTVGVVPAVIDPGLVTYMFNKDKGEYVKTMPEAELKRICSEIGKYFGFSDGAVDGNEVDELRETVIALRTEKDQAFADASKFSEEVDSLKVEVLRMIERGKADKDRIRELEGICEEMQRSNKPSDGVDWHAMYDGLLDRVLKSKNL